MENTQWVVAPRGGADAPLDTSAFAANNRDRTGRNRNLLTRIKEARDSGIPNWEAVGPGLERTGRIVTAAALLFCVAVGAFATSQIVIVKDVGLGVALAVLIDASIVRVFLVPSLMAILGRWNWWPSPQPPEAAPLPASSNRRLRVSAGRRPTTRDRATRASGDEAQGTRLSPTRSSR